MPVRPTLIALVFLIASGCAALHLDESSPQAAPSPPEGEKLVGLVTAAFKTAKLTGTPEVSPVRAAHDAQWGDWMFCIKSSSTADSPNYAVLIGHNAVLEVRSFVLIDGCDKETYHQLEPTDQHRKSGGRK